MTEATETPRVTLDDVVSQSGLRRSEIYRRVKDGKLKAEKTAGGLTFAQADVETLLASLAAARTSFADAARGFIAVLQEHLPDGADEMPETPKTSEEEAPDESAWTAAATSALLDLVAATDATHLYLDPEVDAYRALLRAGGHLRQVATVDKTLGDRIRDKLKADAKATGDGSARGRLALPGGEEGTGPTGHLTTLPSSLGEYLHIAVRESVIDRSFGDLGYTSSQSQMLEEILNGRPGLFLAVGPGDPADELHRTAVGVHLARRGRLVVSLEREDGLRDPSLVQLRYGVASDTVPGFGAVFESALSTRPDVMLVDCVESADQAAGALRGAQSGALVLAQMVSSDLISALRRLGELGLSHRRLAPFLVGVSERRAFRRLCPRCSASTDGGPEGARAPVGCEACLDGFAGRWSIYGLCPGDPALAESLGSAQEDLDGFRAPDQPDLDLRSGALAAVTAGQIHADDVRSLT